MMKDLARIKKAFTDKTEAEYRSRGYEVARDVALDFYPNFRADLLASRNGETKVIAVQTRTGMAVTSDIVGLSEAIKPIPGWSFELLLVGEPELLNAPPDAEPFDAAGIGRGIAEAERALDAGLALAAFVLAWSACEAAVRILAAAAGVEIQRITQTRYLLSHAVYQDAISERDYERLSEMLAYRNAIVHGFEVKDFDAERTKKLIAAAKKLLRAGIASERDDGARVGRDDLIDPLEPSTEEDSGKEIVTSETEIIFEVTEDEADGGLAASALGYGIHTQGDSLEELRSNVKEAVDCYFDETMVKPKLIRLHFVRDEVLIA